MQVSVCKSKLQKAPSLETKETGDEVSEINFFELIPDELLLLLAQYLDVRSLGNFRLVCKKFNVIGRDESLIPAIFKARFPILAGLYPKEKLTEEYYKKAISRTLTIKDSGFTPRQTVFKEGYNFQDRVNALVCRDNLLYASRFARDGGVTVCDLEGKETGYFQFSPIPKCIGLSKNYIFGHSNVFSGLSPSYTGLQRVSLQGQNYTFRNYPQAELLHFKVFDESVYAKSCSGILEIDVESGDYNQYKGTPSQPFFADKHQILGLNSVSIVSWDRETGKSKEDLPLSHHLQKHLSTPLWNPALIAYHQEANLIFLAESYKSLASYDLRLKSMIYKENIHEASITGILFFNNQVATSGRDGCLKIWDYRKFNPHAPLRTLKVGSVISAISANEDCLFLGTQFGDIIKYDFSEGGNLLSPLWDAAGFFREKCIVS